MALRITSYKETRFIHQKLLCWTTSTVPVPNKAEKVPKLEAESSQKLFQNKYIRQHHTCEHIAAASKYFTNLNFSLLDPKLIKFRGFGTIFVKNESPR